MLAENRSTNTHDRMIEDIMNKNKVFDALFFSKAIDNVRVDIIIM
jgi:hypothetical protein